jgi:hypothetical protein
MSRIRKDMTGELHALQQRLRALLRANMEEVGRTMELLAEAERKVEDRFGHLDSLETTWEIAARKFRKQPARNAARREMSRSGSNIRSTLNNQHSTFNG